MADRPGPLPPLPPVQEQEQDQQLLPTPLSTVRESGKPRIYSESDWDAQRTLIKQLYDAENRPLKEVVEILGRTRGFFATYDTPPLFLIQPRLLSLPSFSLS